MKRMYSLFEKRGFRYHRISPLAFDLGTARLRFQTLLLNPDKYMRELRPVDDGWGPGNERIYRPPVERVLNVPDPSSHKAAGFVRTDSQRLPARIPPRACTYRTGQVLNDD